MQCMIAVFVLIASALSSVTLAGASADSATHGIAMHGEPKYGPDFPHLDYANPDAPKGGFISFRGALASQTFDSLNHALARQLPLTGALGAAPGVLDDASPHAATTTADSAIAALQDIPDSGYKKALVAVAEFAVQRRS